MKLSIGFITSRLDPLIHYFFDSLARQITPEYAIDVVVVDYFADEPERKLLIGNSFARSLTLPDVTLLHVNCMPTVWQGKYQLTPEAWWCKSAYLNSFICLAKFSFLAMVDDRSVLNPNWLRCVCEAYENSYGVVGTYEKWARLKVENGLVISSDESELLGSDNRPQYDHATPTHDWYGGHCALPLEWCLQVNGFSSDVCDSLGSEDSMFGVTLRNSGFPMRYDARMKLLEDRTPGEIGGVLKRADKGISPLDKSHAIVDRFRGATTSQNSYDIREVRENVQAGLPFPPPTASGQDWFDGEFLRDMK